MRMMMWAGFCLFALGQANGPVETSREPHHHLRLANSHARVLDITIGPGESTLFHKHSADLVGVTISDAPTRTEMDGRVTDAPAGEVGEIWLEPFSARPVTHRVTNTGSATIRYVAAEILGNPIRTAGVAFPDTLGHRLELKNDRIRVYRVKLAGGEVLGKHVHSGPVLLVGLNSGEVVMNSRLGKARIWRLQAGDFRWYEKGGPGTIRNTTEETFEAVEFEWR